MTDNYIARDALSKEEQKRLDKWSAQLSNTPRSRLKNLTLPDLLLLLEHCPELRESIRQIAASAQHTAIMAEDKSSAEHEPATLQTVEQLKIKLQEAETELKKSRDELQKTQAKLDQTHSEFNQLTQKCEAVRHDLVKSSAAVEKLEQNKEKLQQDDKTLKHNYKSLEKKLQEAQEQLHECQAMQKLVPPELTLLRNDQDLGRRLDLSDLPSDDTQALIQTVAVLAQRENLERLWSALKERCEAENRSASAPERSLLETALVWHNHNWRTRPYRLMEVVPPSAYHFEKHLRSRQTPTGETVVALDLPGIADGNNNPLCKTLVRTR